MQKMIILLLLEALSACILCGCTQMFPIPDDPSTSVSTETNAPLTEAPVDPTYSPLPKELGFEKSIFNGEAIKFETSDFEGPGAALDIDGDGTKEIITLKPEESRPDVWNILLINGEVSKVLDVDGEYWFVSLFGDSIQLAERTEAVMEKDKIKFFSDGGTGAEPEKISVLIISCFNETKDLWSREGMELIIPCSDITKLVHRSSVEEYLYDGAEARLLFPLMVNIDEEHDLNYTIDLDNDGTREDLRLRGGRIMVYEKGSLETPVKEIPYPVYDENGDEGSDPICAEYAVKGYEVRVDESVLVYVNDAEMKPEHGMKPVYGSKGLICADPDSHLIKISFGDGDSGWIMLTYEKDTAVWSIVKTPAA